MTEQEKADRALVEKIWRQRNGYGPDVSLSATDQEWGFFIDLLNGRQNHEKA